MADWQRIADALSGFGAGVQGQGAQFANAIEDRKMKKLLEDKERQAMMVRDAWAVNQLLDQGKAPVALRLLDNRINRINELGDSDPAHTVAIRDALVSGDPAKVAQAKQELQVFSEAGIAAGAWAPPQESIESQKLKFEQDKFNKEQKLKEDEFNWKKANPNAGVAGDASTAHAKDLAIYERMVREGNPNAERFAYMVGLSGRDINSKVELAGRETTAKETSKSDVERTNLAKQNANAYQTYKVGLEGLTSGLQGTTTGAIAGRLPAVTTAQQTAEGAVAAMAPILKAMFRQAGEGTFTDKDQESLMKMVPTRTDTQDAIKAKIANINKIVESKLIGGQVKKEETKTVNWNDL